MAGFQQLMIIGNVGRDPNFKYTQSGIAVCDFSVAVTRRVGGRDGQEKQERTTWVRVTCWRNLAEIANQYVKKGTPIFIVGTVEVSAYMDKSGQPAASLELTAENFQLLGRRDDAQGGGAPGGGYQRDEYEEFRPPSQVDDIPF